MAVEWNEKLAVGVHELDDQHKELFRAFNDLIQACQEDRAEGQIEDLLKFLDDYTRHHFAQEEKLMRGHGYPASQFHNKEHEVFILRLQNLKKEMSEGGPSRALVFQTTRILLKWIITHIKQVDLELGRYIRSRQ